MSSVSFKRYHLAIIKLYDIQFSEHYLSEKVLIALVCLRHMSKSRDHYYIKPCCYKHLVIPLEHNFSKGRSYPL